MPSAPDNWAGGKTAPGSDPTTWNPVQVGKWLRLQGVARIIADAIAYMQIDGEAWDCAQSDTKALSEIGICRNQDMLSSAWVELLARRPVSVSRELSGVPADEYNPPPSPGPARRLGGMSPGRSRPATAGAASRLPPLMPDDEVITKGLPRAYDRKCGVVVSVSEEGSVVMVKLEMGKTLKVKRSNLQSKAEEEEEQQKIASKKQQAESAKLLRASRGSLCMDAQVGKAAPIPSSAGALVAGIPYRGPSLADADNEEVIMAAPFKHERFTQAQESRDAKRNERLQRFCQPWLSLPSWAELTSTGGAPPSYAEEKSALTPSTRLNNKICLWHGDASRIGVHALVNWCSPVLVGGGLTASSIHSAAGPSLREFCTNNIKRLPTGQAAVSPGFRLPAHSVVHASAPRDPWVPKDATPWGKIAHESMFSLAIEKVLVEVKAKGFTSVGIPHYGSDDATSKNPSRESAIILMNSLRNWFENEGGADCVGRVVLVVASASQERLYQELLHEYFPAADGPALVEGPDQELLDKDIWTPAVLDMMDGKGVPWGEGLAFQGFQSALPVTELSDPKYDFAIRAIKRRAHPAMVHRSPTLNKAYLATERERKMNLAKPPTPARVAKKGGIIGPVAKPVFKAALVNDGTKINLDIDFDVSPPWLIFNNKRIEVRWHAEPIKTTKALAFVSIEEELYGTIVISNGSVCENPPNNKSGIVPQIRGLKSLPLPNAEKLEWVGGNGNDCRWAK